MTEQQNDTRQRIVVGVDGSPSCREGLRWAVRQAELTGASVEAITAWSSPAMVVMGTPFTDADAGGGDDSGIKVAAQNMLRAAITEAASQSPGVAVKAEVGEGRRRGCCWTRPRARAWSSWAAGVTAGSPGRCWARSARRCPSTRPARS